MATVFTFANTSGTLNFTLQPSEINSDYDVRVFGQGAQLWGEDVDRNFVRLLENFSISQKISGDYNPVSGNYDYDPNTQEILPRDSNDLGTKLGINNPLTGQMWFNSDTGLLFAFDQDIDPIFGWKRVGNATSGSDTPTSPQQGDMWYDTNVPQLKIWNGSTWISVAERYLLLNGTSSMSGNLNLGTNQIVNLADPINPQEGATKSYVDTNVSSLETDLTSNGLLDSLYVNLNGDTVPGTLTLTNVLTIDQTQGAYIDIPYSSSTLTLGQYGNVTSGSDIRKNSNMLISADGNMYMHFSTGNSFRVAKGGDNRNSGFNNLLTVTSDGIVNVLSGYETLSLSGTSLINKNYLENYVSNNTVSNTGGNFTGAISVNGNTVRHEGNSPTHFATSQAPSATATGDIWFEI